MNHISRYYVVGDGHVLRPVNIKVREGLVIPPIGHEFLPEPMDIKERKRVDGAGRLPVGSIVEDREGMGLYHLVLGRHRDLEIGDEGGVLDFFEQRMVDRIRDAYEQKFRVPSDANGAPLHNLLSQDVRNDIVDGVGRIPQYEANMLSDILEEMKEGGVIKNQIEIKLAKDLTKAVKDKQRP